MIALVEVSAPPGVEFGAVELGTLPEPPGSGCTAFAVRCRDGQEVGATLRWYRKVLEPRPGAPLGLIACATECIQPVADLNHSLVFVLDPGHLSAGALPAGALEALRDAGIEGRILEEIVTDHGSDVLVEHSTLRAVDFNLKLEIESRFGWFDDASMPVQTYGGGPGGHY